MKTIKQILILSILPLLIWLSFGATTSQVQPEILFDTQASMIAFTPALDGMICYTKDSKIHWVYDASISAYKPVTATSNIFVQTNSVTVANTTATTSLLGTGQGIKTVPIGFFGIGRNLTFKSRGFRSRTSGNETYVVSFNGTIILTTGAILLGAGSNDEWEMDALITCRSIGTTGTVFSQGKLTNLSNGNILQMVSLVPVTINTTIAQTIDFSIAWGTANAGNTITSTNALIFI